MRPQCNKNEMLQEECSTALSGIIRKRRQRTVWVSGLSLSVSLSVYLRIAVCLSPYHGLSLCLAVCLSLSRCLSLSVSLSVSRCLIPFYVCVCYCVCVSVFVRDVKWTLKGKGNKG